jgi:hypothetical protein
MRQPVFIVAALAAYGAEPVDGSHALAMKSSHPYGAAMLVTNGTSLCHVPSAFGTGWLITHRHAAGHVLRRCSIWRQRHRYPAIT